MALVTSEEGHPCSAVEGDDFERRHLGSRHPGRASGHAAEGDAVDVGPRGDKIFQRFDRNVSLHSVAFDLRRLPTVPRRRNPEFKFDGDGVVGVDLLHLNALSKHFVDPPTAAVTRRCFVHGHLQPIEPGAGLYWRCTSVIATMPTATTSAVKLPIIQQFMSEPPWETVGGL